MPSGLMMSVSGIRGIVGETMTPELITAVASAMARILHRGTVVMGRDTRPTGDAIARGIASSLSLAGLDVVDIGIVPTPTVQIMVEELHAAGGIVISASHNPIQWNAFKLINKTGSFFSPREVERLFGELKNPICSVPWNHIGALMSNADADTVHLRKILNVIDYKKIRKMKFRVVLDAVNGAGSFITQKLLQELCCTVIPINCTPDGTFPRGAEPIPENLKKLSRVVRLNSAHIGFAQDPDADRLACVNEKGKPIGEEYTIALVAEHLLTKKKGRVVVNCSTTKAVEDIARKHGSPFKRTKVGEINVVEEMKRGGARIGGEGNGGVISPEVHLGRDSLVGIGYILEMMAYRKKNLSELVSELPQYSMIKGKISLEGKSVDPLLLNDIKGRYKNETISEIDGLRIDFNQMSDFRGDWVHLRPSNTEPIFRIIVEGKTPHRARELYKIFTSHFSISNH